MRSHVDNSFCRNFTSLWILFELAAVTSSNNKSSDVQSTNVSPAIYVACVFGGLCIGFAIGGVISLFAYQCYFKQRYLKKSETTKSFEMGE